MARNGYPTGSGAQVDAPVGNTGLTESIQSGSPADSNVNGSSGENEPSPDLAEPATRTRDPNQIEALREPFRIGIDRASHTQHWAGGHSRPRSSATVLHQNSSLARSLQRPEGAPGGREWLQARVLPTPSNQQHSAIPTHVTFLPDVRLCGGPLDGFTLGELSLLQVAMEEGPFPPWDGKIPSPKDEEWGDSTWPVEEDDSLWPYLPGRRRMKDADFKSRPLPPIGWTDPWPGGGLPAWQGDGEGRGAGVVIDRRDYKEGLPKKLGEVPAFAGGNTPTDEQLLRQKAAIDAKKKRDSARSDADKEGGVPAHLGTKEECEASAEQWEWNGHVNVWMLWRVNYKTVQLDPNVKEAEVQSATKKELAELEGGLITQLSARLGTLGEKDTLDAFRRNTENYWQKHADELPAAARQAWEQELTWSLANEGLRCWEPCKPHITVIGQRIGLIRVAETKTVTRAEYVSEELLGSDGRAYKVAHAKLEAELWYLLDFQYWGDYLVECR